MTAGPSGSVAGASKAPVAGVRAETRHIAPRRILASIPVDLRDRAARLAGTPDHQANVRALSGADADGPAFVPDKPIVVEAAGDGKFYPLLNLDVLLSADIADVKRVTVHVIDPADREAVLRHFQREREAHRSAQVIDPRQVEAYYED